MTTTTNIAGHLGIVRPQGSYSFEAHGSFQDAVKAVLDDPSVRDVQIDLAAVDHMDSVMLGLLLHTREHAINRGLSISLVNAKSAVRAVLGIANFGTLFDIK